jgi:proline iminopeptidase
MTKFTQTGYVSSVAGESWYGVVGDLATQVAPLVLLHGGPGFTSYAQEPLSALADILPIVFIDQAGCGRARREGGRKDFTLEGFVSELESIRAALSIDRMHLLGHSFGGLICGEYYFTHKEYVASIIFQSASIDIPRWISDSKRLRASFPIMTKIMLTEGEKTDNYSFPEYLRALTEYYDRHVYRFTVKPQCIIQSEVESDAETYTTVWGPNELVVSGVVAHYSLTPRLPDIAVPTLFLCGRHDEATPEAHQFFAQSVAGSQCKVFEDSAHHPQLNETVLFLDTLRGFYSGLK